MALDGDFDKRNTALRYYFIMQASYHFHSLCFQLLSLLLLFLYGGQEGSRLVSMKSSMKNYFRPLVEHMIAMLLIVVAFCFSGLRRLGAVAMFTLDISSVFLHLLQLCMNAPESSVLRSGVWFLHQWIVVPTFMYFRLFIFPFIVWHSIAFESTNWLDQIEKMLFPGSARCLYVFFNGLILILQVLNCVFFRRLLRLRIKTSRVDTIR
mmetsp:Transcript_40696/g.59789  ORF Transcript_40696/g.59789 Transcript_40696/m.59789 type:complete len:208 (-) Transcript_40696:360-983(-)